MSDAAKNQHENPDALVEGNRVGTAEDMESTEKPGTKQPGYVGEAPNAPLASQGSRDGTPAGMDQDDE